MTAATVEDLMVDVILCFMEARDVPNLAGQGKIYTVRRRLQHPDFVARVGLLPAPAINFLKSTDIWLDRNGLHIRAKLGEVHESTPGIEWSQVWSLGHHVFVGSAALKQCMELLNGYMPPPRKRGVRGQSKNSRLSQYRMVAAIAGSKTYRQVVRDTMHLGKSGAKGADEEEQLGRLRSYVRDELRREKKRLLRL